MNYFQNPLRMLGLLREAFRTIVTLAFVLLALNVIAALKPDAKLPWFNWIFAAVWLAVAVHHMYRLGGVIQDERAIAERREGGPAAKRG